MPYLNVKIAQTESVSVAKQIVAILMMHTAKLLGKKTEGTNTKSEKAQYVKNVFSDFDTILGSITPANYNVIHDIRADSWGFQGKTQEYRFIQSQSLYPNTAKQHLHLIHISHRVNSPQVIRKSYEIHT